MLLRIFSLGENARRLDHDLSADRRPIDRGRIALRKNAKLVVPDLDAVFSSGYVLVQIAEHRIVLQQVRERFRVRQIVDSDEIDVRITDGVAINISSDASEAINTNLNCHSKKSSCRC